MTLDAEHTSHGSFQIRQCQRDDCRFRYPVPAGTEEGQLCPLCCEPAPYASKPYVGQGTMRPGGGADGPRVVALLDNLRSSYNVGSMFRTCDGAGVDHVHLCGISSTPDQQKVIKTALGAEQFVPWTYHRNGLEAIRVLKDIGYLVWSLENHGTAQPIFDHAPETLRVPIVLVVGNELSGIDPAILDESDCVVSLPMLGDKYSLNAVVAFGVAVYWLRFGGMLTRKRL